MTRCVVRIMEKYRHKLLRCVQGGGGSGATQWCPWGEALPSEAHGFYNRKGEVFANFGSAFINLKFIIFCPYLTIRTNQNFNFLEYPDRPLADGRMVTLLYTFGNFDAERDSKIHMWQWLLSERLFIMTYSLFFTCISL